MPRFLWLRVADLGWTLVCLWLCVITAPLGQMTPCLRKVIGRDAVMVLSPDMVETLLRHGTYTEKLRSLARVRGCF